MKEADWEGILVEEAHTGYLNKMDLIGLRLNSTDVEKLQLPS